jgi:hypothetical protein
MPRFRRINLLTSFKVYWPFAAAAAGAFWALWQFYFKEIYVPANQPANLVVDARLEAGYSQKNVSASRHSGSSQPNMTPITLSVKVVNDSNKTMQLLSPYWIAYGIDVNIGKTVDSEVFLLNIQNRMFGRRFLALEGVESRRHFLGMGTLVDDEFIMPKEVLTTKKILPLLNRQYEIVRINVVVASAREIPKGKLIKPLIEFTNFHEPSPIMCWSMFDQGDLRDRNVMIQSAKLERPLADASTTDYTPCRGVPNILSDNQLKRFNVQVVNSVSELWLE